MPLVVRGDDAPPIKKPDPVQITDPQYRGIAVDTRYQPANALLTTLEGSSWFVEYYQQILDDDNGLNGQITNREAVFQQYRLIHEFEFRVTNPLTSSQNNDTKEMTLTGSANIHPVLVPNVGDMFLADVGDGREGVFRITSSERRSIFKETAHFIEYELISYSTPERLADFKRKTVQVLHYSKDFNYYGQNPLIEEEQYYLIKDLKVALQSMTVSYFKKFFSNEYHSLAMPAQSQAIYDHFLVKAIKASFNTDEANELLYLRAFDVSDDQTMGAISLWDAVLNQDKRYLLHAFERAGVMSAYTFTREPMMESFYHSGFQAIVYPKDNEVSVDYELEQRTKDGFLDVMSEVPSRIGKIDTLLTQEDLEGLPYEGATLIHPVLIDDFYIFSQFFYDGSVGQSKLELAVRDHIENKPVNRKLLKVLSQTYHAWGGLERFYYTPILMMLIKSVIIGA